MPNNIILGGLTKPAFVSFDVHASNDAIFEQPDQADMLHSDGGTALCVPQSFVEDSWALSLLEPEDRVSVLADMGFDVATMDDVAIFVESEHYYEGESERLDPHSQNVPIIEAFIDLSQASAIERQMVEIDNVPTIDGPQPKQGFRAWLGRIFKRSTRA